MSKTLQTAPSRNQDTSQTTADYYELNPDLASEFKQSEDAQIPLRISWDEKESMLIGKQNESSSTSAFKARVTDSRIATIVIERAARVMAQIPTGRVQALTQKDKGASAIASMYHTRYIIPNANAQFDYLTKLRMVDLYSQVFGIQAVLFDLSTTERYVGPDFWLIPIRSFFPQPGKLSIEDSEYAHVETYVSASWLERQKGKGDWSDAAIDRVLELVKDGGTSPTALDSTKRTATQKLREISVPGGQGGAAKIRLVTRYENGSKGHWISFFPDFDNIVGRDTDNKDNTIPIKIKAHIPLIDSIYGLGAFERGKTLQYAMDSLNAMYFAGVQMSIFPPRIIDPEGVVLESLDYAPAATWQETKPDSIRNYNVSPQGLQTYQSSYSFLTGALLNQNGATDTSQTAQNTSDPTAGKTPEALKRQASRESAADNWDRFQMEKFIESLTESLINLGLRNQDKAISLHVFDTEIQKLQDALGKSDKSLFKIYESGNAGELTIPKQAQKTEYKYIIDATTTQEADTEIEHAVYNEILKAITAAPQLIDAVAQSGMTLNVGELIKQYIISTGTKDWDKIIEDNKGAEGVMDGQADKTAVPGMPGMDPNTMPQPGQPGTPGQLSPMAQTMSGQPAPPPPPAPEPPDPSKDPDHQFILAHFKELSIPAQRKIAAAIVGPEAMDGILPIEAEMVNQMSSPTPTDEQPISADLDLIDPGDPLQGAKDPHAHLNSSADPATRELFQALALHSGGQDQGQPQPTDQPQPQPQPEPMPTPGVPTAIGQ